MTSYWDAGKLDIPMQLPMVIPIAMAMVVMSTEQKPLMIAPAYNDTHTMIGDFTNMTACNSNDDLHFGTSYEFVVGLSDAGHSGSGDIEYRVT